MRLVTETAGDRQLAECHVGGEHEMACPIEASLDHIGMGRLAEAVPEGAREMRCAEADRNAQIGNPDRLGQILFN